MNGFAEHEASPAVHWRWRRLGHVYDPQRHARPGWMHAFAQCPTPFVLDAHTVRVVVSSRPEPDPQGQYVSLPGYVDLRRDSLDQIIGLSETPLLALGEPGSFDEFGIMPSSVIEKDGQLLLYYTGWTRMASVPFTTAIGLAISEDGGQSFHKAGPGPLLNIGLNDPYLVNTPIVRRFGNQWHMWYVSGRHWIETGDKAEILLRVAHASSDDGLKWQPDGHDVVPTSVTDECQDMFCPLPIGEGWHAFFGYRHATGFRHGESGGYRLGHAWSADLRHWTRDDRGLDLGSAPGEWDADMVNSMQVIEVDGRKLLFYCGNDFGRHGFGVSELLREG